MSNKPSNFRTIISAMRDSRKAAPEVREERLHTMVGLRGSPALALSAWRGRSGRRYVVGIHDIGLNTEAMASAPAVLIAVRRAGSGLSELLDARAASDTAEADAWIEAAREAGATEIHVHRLAEGANERTRIVDDLLQPATETEAA